MQKYQNQFLDKQKKRRQNYSMQLIFAFNMQLE